MTDFREYRSSESCSHWPQILSALSVSYICISAGNILGYTSSAIPSIRTYTSNPNNLLNISTSTPAGDNWTDYTVHENKTMDDIYDLNMELNEYTEFMNLTDTQASWISGLAPLGAFVGSLIATVPAEYIGPKGTILFVGGPIFLLSWLVTAFAPSIDIIYLGRLLGGLAMGLSIATSPVYVVETASVKLRGPLGTLSQCMLTVGILISFILGGYFDWRQSALSCAVLVTPVFVMLAFTPESPMWLLSKNRLREAELSYCRLRGAASNHLEFQEMKDRAREAVNDNKCSYKTERSTILSKFSRPAVKSVLVALGLMSFQQFTGVSTINFYAVSIFKSAAGPDSKLNEHVSSIIVALVQCIGTFCSFFLIERLGRKLLLVLSILFIGLATIIMGTFFYILENGDAAHTMIWLPLVSLITFEIAFSLGYGPVCFIICAEIIAPEIRTLVNPIAVGVNWLCVFLVTKTFPDLINCIDTFGVFWLYGVLAFIGLIFTVFCVPETRGKSEAEIQRFFGKRFVPDRRWEQDDLDDYYD